MFRTSIFLVFALSIMATGSAVTPASAFPSQGSVGHMEQPLPHFHAVNSPGVSRWRPPSKKRA